MPARKQHRRDSEKLPGIEELNLAEWPLGLLAKRIPAGRKSVTFQDEITDTATGTRVRREVKLIGSEERGLPMQTQDVLLALMKLTNDKHGFRQREVEFSLYELRKLLGWPHDGRYNAKLKCALLTLLGMTIVCENSWRKEKRWASLEGFHLLDNVRLAHTVADFDEEEPQVFKWNDVVVESIQAGNTKGLDWEFYKSLKLPTSKRLYRLLDKRFGIRPSWVWDAAEFGRNKLGMSPNLRPHEYSKWMQPAVAELEQRGFLSSMPHRERFERVGKGVFAVSFHRGRKLVERKAAPVPSRLAEELSKRGFRNAGEFVEKYPEERVRETLENYDDRRGHGEDLGPGWIRRAIESPEGFGFRKGFRPKAQREADDRKRAERERTNRAGEQARVDREQAEQLAKRTVVRNYLASVSADQRRAIEQEAIERGDRLTRGLYETNVRQGAVENAEMYREILIERHVIGLMEDDAGSEEQKAEGRNES